MTTNAVAANASSRLMSIRGMSGPVRDLSPTTLALSSQQVRVQANKRLDQAARDVVDMT